MEYSHHSLILLAGFALAGLALFGAIAVGPYGRRGVRPFLTLVSVAAFAGSAFYLMTYLGLLEQRRAIETRLAALRAQALSTSTLACLERSGEIVESACAQTLFSAPETLAAANVYTAARFDVLMAAARYTGPRTAQFDDAIVALEHSLRQDPFGLTANVLVLREGCTAQRCDSMAVFSDPTRLWSNIRQKTFEANASRYAVSWRAPGSAPAASGPGIISPTGTETRAPIPDKYTLPSSDSIPPVSIMNDEPQRRETAPPAAAQRPAPAAPVQAETQQAEQPTVTAPAAAQPKRTRPAAQKQQQQRRETARPSGPMSITPKQ